MQKEFHLSERMSRIDTSQIRRAFDLASKLKDPLNLSIGQPHYRMPDEIAAAIEKAIRDGKTTYTPTQGIFPLREAISQKETTSARTVNPDNVIISSGVSSLLQLIFMSFIDPGDTVVLIDPYFLMYKSLADFFNARIITLPEDFTEDDIQSLDASKLKMILYASPSNPTGSILQRKQIQSLANLAESTGAILVSDEIYELFDYDEKFVSAGDVYPDSIVLKGFSKTFNMTGLRISYASGPSPVIKALTILQQYTVVCAPAPVQWAGITALGLDMSEYVNLYRKNRDLCVNMLKEKTKFPYPSGAFYIFPEVPESDAVFIERAASEKNLIIVPGNIFSRKNHHVRISYATTEEKLKAGLQAFLDLL